MIGRKKNLRRKILGSFIVAINDEPVYSKKDAIDLFTSLYEANSTSISVTFADAPATPAADKDRALIELDLAVPTTIDTPDFDH